MELIEKNKESMLIRLHRPACGPTVGYFILGVSSSPSLSSILLKIDRAARFPGKNPTSVLRDGR